MEYCIPYSTKFSRSTIFANFAASFSTAKIVLRGIGRIGPYKQYITIHRHIIITFFEPLCVTLFAIIRHYVFPLLFWQSLRKPEAARPRLPEMFCPQQSLPQTEVKCIQSE